MSTQQVIDCWQNGIEPYRKLEHKQPFYGIAGKGREYEANPDPRFNPQVKEQILKAISSV